ncbi:MAG: anti-sigma factor family protein [Anaerolineales bacterium]
MFRHLSQRTLHAYLDDTLPPEDRRRAWGHLCACAGCNARLARLQREQTHLRGRFAALPAWRPSDHLPGILRAAARPARWRPPSRVVAWGLLLVFVMGLPLVPSIRQAALDAGEPWPSVHEIPSTTPTPAQPGTARPALLRAERPPLPNPIHIEYASPVPQPPDR